MAVDHQPSSNYKTYALRRSLRNGLSSLYATSHSLSLAATPASPRNAHSRRGEPRFYACTNMATQSNLDYQSFWAPRPASRPRCVDGQSHIHPLPQPNSLLLPLNDSRGIIDVSKAPDSPPRLASSSNNVIYISNDAASDIDDTSYELFNISLLLI